ncbi:MarR family winged helix-turn-helix transcriptional regulator [Nonomuraea jabiensis]|uniref:MarR family winged helix-turn-helix transcriptional regulator n=1 Tax=Nonomuraea jabiensis TaxID=882448 RepID=UPI003D73497E
MKSPEPATTPSPAPTSGATIGGATARGAAATLTTTGSDATSGSLASTDDVTSRDATGADATSGSASSGVEAPGVGASSGSATGSAERAVAERNLCGLVGALAKQIEGHIRERAGALNLTAAQAVALRELTGPMTMRDLADRMSCEPSNATFVVDRLEEQGIVERRPHPGDRRAKQLVLTSEGVALRERLIDSLTEDSPLARLTSEEQAALNDLLTRAVR